MNLSLENKFALVCGGSKGIGLASAIALSELGCNVTLLSRNVATLSEAMQKLDRSKRQVHRFIAVDQSNPQEVAKRLSTIGYGFHILVLNSGGPAAGNLINASLDDLQQGFNALLLSNQVIIKHSYEYMKQSNFGRIINIISIGLKEPIPGLGVSNTIRGAVGSWAKTLSAELGPYGITVNNILPGYTLTDRLENLMKSRALAQKITYDEIIDNYVDKIPARRLATPDEIGNAVAFLASPAAGYINGVNLPVDGGYLHTL